MANAKPAKPAAIVECPPELVGVAHHLDALPPQQRATIAAAVYATLASALMVTNSLPPIDPLQRAVVDRLHEEGIATAEELAEHIGVSATTIKTWCGPDGVLREHGVTSTKRGYGLRSS